MKNFLIVKSIEFVFEFMLFGLTTVWKTVKHYKAYWFRLDRVKNYGDGFMDFELN